MTTVAHPGILEAARGVFEQYGARRANAEDVARAAGISRSTLYRAYPNKEALLEAVLVAEFDAFLTELDRVASDLPPQEAVVECFAQGMALTREIPLLARLAQTEPELVTAAGARGARGAGTARGNGERHGQGCGQTQRSLEMHGEASSFGRGNGLGLPGSGLRLASRAR